MHMPFDLFCNRFFLQYIIPVFGTGGHTQQQKAKQMSHDSIV
jgi:hypothetical protein